MEAATALATLAVALAALALVVALRRQPSPASAFEFCSRNLGPLYDRERHARDLAALAADGWELIGLVHAPDERSLTALLRRLPPRA